MALTFAEERVGERVLTGRARGPERFMKMPHRPWLHWLIDERGHTIAETVVAMSLFVGVLLPLLAAIGSLMFDDTAARIHEALHLAQSEMARAEAEVVLKEGTLAEHGLKIERTVTFTEDLAQIEILVYDMRKDNGLVLHLAKTVALTMRIGDS